MDNIQSLVAISQFYGNDKDFIIAGGGNTSYKDDEKIWVKASGTSLATIQEDGFVVLDRSKLKVISECEYPAESSAREEAVKQDMHEAIIDKTKGLRPSVETSMHNVISYPFVVHTHPMLINALMCSSNAKTEVEALFDDPGVFIPYTDPGYILFKKVEDEIKAYRAKKGYDPKIIWLENHGIFVSADNTDEIDAIYNEVVAKISSKISSFLVEEVIESSDVLKGAAANLAAKFGNEGIKVGKSRNSKLIASFVSSAKAFKGVSTSFTPDDIVYCKANYLFVEKTCCASTIAEEVREQLDAFKAKFGYAPKVIAVKGEGIIAIEDSEKSCDIVLDIFENMMKVSYYAENFGSPQFMTAEQIAFIDNWEVENYRRKMSKQ